MGFFSKCEHEWEEGGHRTEGLFRKKWVQQHQCKKCGKKEDCIEKTEYHSWGWETNCVVCGKWLNDDGD